MHFVTNSYEMFFLLPQISYEIKNLPQNQEKGTIAYLESNQKQHYKKKVSLTRISSYCFIFNSRILAKINYLQLICKRTRLIPPLRNINL